MITWVKESIAVPIELKAAFFMREEAKNSRYIKDEIAERLRAIARGMTARLVIVEFEIVTENNTLFDRRYYLGRQGNKEHFANGKKKLFMQIETYFGILLEDVVREIHKKDVRIEILQSKLKEANRLLGMQ